MQRLHLEPGVVVFGVLYSVRPQEVAVALCSVAAAAASASAAAALSLSELPLQWAVLWKILSGGDVQGHSLFPPFLCYIPMSLSHFLASFFFRFISFTVLLYPPSPCCVSSICVLTGLPFLRWQVAVEVFANCEARCWRTKDVSVRQTAHLWAFWVHIWDLSFF